MKRGSFLLMLLLFIVAKVSSQETIQKRSLEVVSNIQTFKSTVLLDSNNKMEPVCRHLMPCYTDFKYATTNNFTGKVLYQNPEAYLRLPAAKALANVNRELMQKGYLIKVYDAYRPYDVTVTMWQVVPDERYTANPTKGSGHNRGAAVDVTLVDLITGQEAVMPTAYDDFSEKAHHSFKELPKEAIANRELLKNTMVKHGFEVFETEWWHYSWPGMTEKFAVLNLTFQQLGELAME